MRDDARPSEPRRARLRPLLGAPWRWLARSWPALTASAAGWSLWLALQPGSWRRPVRDEFWRFADLSGPGSLRPVIIAAALTGVGLVGQGVFWLDRVGQREVIETTLFVILIREVTPLVVGLVMLGRAGLINLAELGVMRANGTVRSLEAQGLDPLLLFVMPRALALGLCTFVHGIVFLAVNAVVGHYVAQALGVAVGDLFQATRLLLRVMGEVGLFVLPLKTMLIGVVIAVATSTTALAPLRGGDDLALMPRGFFRALLMLFIVALLGSMVA